jgi:hypothetical protein
MTRKNRLYDDLLAALFFPTSLFILRIQLDITQYNVE